MTQPDAGDLGLHVPRMYRVALRILGDADRAEDVVQEACVRALRGMSRFDGRAALATWLHRITVNCALMHLRHRRRAGSRQVDLDDELAGLAAVLDAAPSSAAERHELYRIAAAMVEDLPDDCRRAFVLTQLDGYSYDEAAAIEGEPRGTVASRVYRAKKILLDQLAAQTGGRSVS